MNFYKPLRAVMTQRCTQPVVTRPVSNPIHKDTKCSAEQEITWIIATNSDWLSTCCVTASARDLAEVTELRKKYLQLYCTNWNKSSYNVCFTSGDGHCTHKHTHRQYVITGCTTLGHCTHIHSVIGVGMRRSRGEVPLHPRYNAVMGVAARTAL